MPLIVAIDGPAGSGKSSTAKAVARRLRFEILDTGAMYRVVGLYLSRLGLVGPTESEPVAQLLEQLVLRFEGSGAKARVFLGDEDVTERIRSPEVSTLASRVSTYPAVRKRLVALQREATAALLENAPGVVVEGRDIGTVVFPNADLKVYMDASDEVRAERRRSELQQTGQSLPLNRVLRDIRDRDTADRERSLAPLRPAEDAIVIDTSALGFEEQVGRIVEEIERVRSNNSKDAKASGDTPTGKTA